ncbi:MAG: Ig-like domain-containing protein, partial [Pirellula sp.]
YNALKNVDGLTLDLFSPSTILSLMMGESNVNLITYDIPDFNFAFDIAKEFKIWGPIAGKLEGGFSVSTDLSMGFDTNGLEQWAAQGFDPLKSYLALDGIYFDDWNPAGAEKDELTVRAYIAAGVGLDIGIASGFVKGGVEGIVGFDIVDVGERSGTSDGKIRGSDFIEKLSTSPGDLFDLTGTVNAFLGAEVTVNLLFVKKVVYNDRLATIELAKFKLSDSGARTSYPGRVQTGPIIGGTVWFDANNNFALDPGEYSTQTDADGNYTLELPDDLDVTTGTIRASGGRDASTGTSNLANLVVPSGARGNATALTALQAALVSTGKVSLEESQSKIKSALGIDSSIDLSTFAHIDQALAGNEKAAPVLLATNILNTVAMQLSSTLEGAMGVGLNNPRYSGLLSKAVFSAMAEELVSGSLDLTVTDRLQRILTNSVSIANNLFESVGSPDRIDLAVLTKYQSTILSVLQASARNILALAQRAKNVIDLEQKITKAKVNLNDKTPADLYALIRGTKSAADVLRDNARTDTAYLNLIEQVKLPPLISPIRNISVFEDERIPSIPFSVRRQSSGTMDLQVSVTSDNPTLLPPNAMAIQYVYKDALAVGYRLQIVPAAYQFGSANITLRIVDPQGGVQTQTFKLDVGHVNHAPEVTNDVVVGAAGRRISLNPLANDIDRDGDKLTLGLISMPDDGLTVVNPDGTISYTSSPDARGRRDFVYQVSDGVGKTATARIMLDLVEGPRGVAIEQKATPATVAGHEVVYQLTLTNLGLTAANNIVVTDVLPSQVVFSSIVLPPGFTATTPAENRGGTVTVRGASLPADASVTLWIIGRVPTNFGAAGTIVNTATVQSSVVNPDTPRTLARASTRLNMAGAAIAPSTTANVNDLVITGSAGADQIVVSQNASRDITVDIGGQRQGTFQVNGSILVYAGAGNDTVVIDPSITRQAYLYGGAGNDTLWGSSAGGVLVGGDGNDTLNARNSRNILIGGQGSDTLNGALGNNILIAGFTVYDAHQRALDAILKEWSSNATYAQRTARIEGASGGLNGVFSFSPGRVVDDNAVDSVLGDSGFNWYFTRETGNRKDSVLRRKAGEKTNRL